MDNDYCFWETVEIGSERCTKLMGSSPSSVARGPKVPSDLLGEGGRPSTSLRMQLRPPSPLAQHRSSSLTGPLKRSGRGKWGDTGG